MNQPTYTPFAIFKSRSIGGIFAAYFPRQRFTWTVAAIIIAAAIAADRRR